MENIRENMPADKRACLLSTYCMYSTCLHTTKLEVSPSPLATLLRRLLDLCSFRGLSSRPAPPRVPVTFRVRLHEYNLPDRRTASVSAESNTFKIWRLHVGRTDAPRQSHEHRGLALLCAILDPSSHAHTHGHSVIRAGLGFFLPVFSTIF